jgi:uncharacterized protein
MVDITPRLPNGRQLIERYGEHKFLISGATYETPVLVCESKTYPQPNLSFQELLETRFDELIVNIQGCEFGSTLLIGTGSTSMPLEAGYKQRFRENGVSVDVMDTGAACRTFNILQTEDRVVSAILMPVD